MLVTRWIQFYPHVFYPHVFYPHLNGLADNMNLHPANSIDILGCTPGSQRRLFFNWNWFTGYFVIELQMHSFGFCIMSITSVLINWMIVTMEYFFLLVLLNWFRNVFLKIFVGYVFFAWIHFVVTLLLEILQLIQIS